MFTLLQLISLRCHKFHYLALSCPAMRDKFYGFPLKITVHVLESGCQLSSRKFYRYFLHCGGHSNMTQYTNALSPPNPFKTHSDQEALVPI